jgi:hypothetical protein
VAVVHRIEGAAIEDEQSGHGGSAGQQGHGLGVGDREQQPLQL